MRRAQSPAETDSVAVRQSAIQQIQIEPFGTGMSKRLEHAACRGYFDLGHIEHHLEHFKRVTIVIDVKDVKAFIGIHGHSSVK